MDSEYSDEDTIQKKKYIQIDENEGEINVGVTENDKAKNKTTLTGKPPSSPNKNRKSNWKARNSKA